MTALVGGGGALAPSALRGVRFWRLLSRRDYISIREGILHRSPPLVASPGEEEEMWLFFSPASCLPGDCRSGWHLAGRIVPA